jgi:hypothetical protein
MPKIGIEPDTCMSDPILEAFRGNPEFVALMKSMVVHRPVIPAFSLAKTESEQYMVVEAIKFNTARRQGFDALYLHLTGTQL